MLLKRNKHILLGEKYGWDTVACYTVAPLATDSDNEKRIRKAIKESKQLRDEKKRSATANRRRKGVFPGNLLNREYLSTDQPPLLPWRENSFLPTRCTPHVFAVFDRDTLPGIADQQLPPAGPMGVDKQAPNSLPSDKHSELHFEANDAECGLVNYDNCIDELDKLEQNSVVIVKGRLRENIAFWRSFGASQWLLNVLCEGYCLPFVGLPANKFFPQS